MRPRDRIFIILAIGSLCIALEFLGFRALNREAEQAARDLGKILQSVGTVAEAAATLTNHDKKAAPQDQKIPEKLLFLDLLKDPREFDGRLIQVRAWLAFGWEGDNFLFDSPETAPRNMASHRSASVWFYCKPDHERKVWDTIKFGGPPVLGTFTGYFHFVPDQKSRIKDAFDPGPLQLEVVGVSDLAPNAEPNTFGPATPR